jgi:hypothetical protein
VFHKDLAGNDYCGAVDKDYPFGVLVYGVQVLVNDFNIAVTIVCQSSIFGGLNVQNILTFRQFRRSLNHGN